MLPLWIDWLSPAHRLTSGNPVRQRGGTLGRVVHTVEDDAEFGYRLQLLPPGRVGFRRWRWELWQGPSLLAAGWRLSEHQAERALRAAASRAGHARLGVHPLDPERNALHGELRRGTPARLDCGALTLVLVPLG